MQFCVTLSAIKGHCFSEYHCDCKCEYKCEYKYNYIIIICECNCWCNFNICLNMRVSVVENVYTSSNNDLPMYMIYVSMGVPVWVILSLSLSVWYIRNGG